MGRRISRASDQPQGEHSIFEMAGSEESWLERQARIVAQFSLLAEECLQGQIWTLLKNVEARFCATENEVDLSPTITTSTPPPTQEALQSLSSLFRSDSNAEAGMRTIEDIISEAKKHWASPFRRLLTPAGITSRQS